MKRLFLSILIAMMSFTAFCQEQEESVKQRFFDAKIREFVYRLELTDQQKEQFIPIYKRYNDEMKAAVVGNREKRPMPPATAEEAAALEKSRIERQQAAQAIRMKYVDEFATVLNPGQLSRLFEVESQIQRKLMNRKSGHGPGQGRGHGHPGPHTRPE